MTLRTTYGEKSIDDFVGYLRHRKLELSPGFQRKSVWTAPDRRNLIRSIAEGCPLPSVFLYRRNQGGKVVFDVIDGKQRLETIFMFLGQGRFKRESFEAPLDLGDGTEPCAWKTVRRRRRSLFEAMQSYKLQTVEVEGDLSEIIDLFVRINSTGKRLTPGEKRHAKYYTSEFLKAAERLVGRYRSFLTAHRILTNAQIERMKATELFAEILMSIEAKGPINKKTSLDRAIGNQKVHGGTLSRLVREFVRTMNRLKLMFPRLQETRLKNSAEFYSLFLLVWEMDREGMILHERRRNDAAFALLRRLSVGVDELRLRMRKAEFGRPAERIYQEYLTTVQGDTDSAANRERRASILRGILSSLFERKDDKRAFSIEQRRILWNSEERHVCPRCRRPLTWADVSVDHVRAWSKGGRTDVRNARLMHKRCNASKGNR